MFREDGEGEKRGELERHNCETDGVSRLNLCPASGSIKQQKLGICLGMSIAAVV